MKTTTRLLLLACLSMPLLVACNKGEDKPAVEAVRELMARAARPEQD